MKKIITFIAIAVVGLFYSCGDILEILPVSNSQAEEFYSTDEEVTQGLAGIYARLGRFNTNDDFPTTHHLVLSESRSDNWYIATQPNAQRDQADVRRFQASAVTGSVGTSFNRLYSMISGANMMLSVAPEADYRVEIAQARFLRGYAYFELGRTWGAVPIVLTPIEKTDAPDFERKPLTEVYAQALEDLNYAKDNLPNMYTGVDAGRANAWAARTLIAYIHATMAGYPLNDGTAYQKAVDVLSPIMSDLAPRLAANYHDIFDYTKENLYDLFSVQFNAGNAGLGSSLMGYQTSNGFAQWSTYTRQGQDMRVDSLLIDRMLEEGDVRAAHPMITGGYWNIKTPPEVPTAADTAESYTTRRYLLTKYLVKDVDNAVVKAWNDGPINFPIVRTADAYLLYAEALVGTNRAGEAKKWVDDVRNRAGLPSLTAAPTMADIFDERRKEFIGEGKRYYDLVRQGEAIFTGTLNPFLDHYEQTTTYRGSEAERRDMLLPIPQSSMEVHPTWDQNPDY